MSRHAGALLILIASCAGCSRAATERLRAVSAPVPTTNQLPASQPTPATTSRVIALPMTTLTPTTTTVASAAPESAERTASETVEALTDGHWNANLPDAALWASALAGGSIVQVTILSESGGRADVAVSVAFAEPTSEPVGIRIQLRLTDTAWVVDGMGYL